MNKIVSLLSDSGGKIQKILFHQTYAYYKGKQISKGIFTDFLNKFNKIEKKPEIYIISSYRNDEERKFLNNELNEWKPYVKKIVRKEINVSKNSFRTLPYAQDVCVILNSINPSAIMSKSNRITSTPFIPIIKELVNLADLKIHSSSLNYNLEGGYVYAGNNISLYSNKKDSKIIKSFEQKAIFVDNFIGTLAHEFLNIIRPGVNLLTLPSHIDLMFSIFDRGELLELFYVDFSDTLYLEPQIYGYKEILLERRLREYEEKINQIIKQIKNATKVKINVHKIPGRIGMETIYGQWGISNYYYIYSGTNLLFHSNDGKDYAFYLKIPDSDASSDLINKNIESSLSKANIKPISISGKKEEYNLFEFLNSAGIRCIIKILKRDYARS